MGILLFLFYALLGAVMVWSVSYLLYRVARGLRGDCNCGCASCGGKSCCQKRDGTLRKGGQ